MSRATHEPGSRARPRPPRRSPALTVVFTAALALVLLAIWLISRPRPSHARPTPQHSSRPVLRAAGVLSGALPASPATHATGRASFEVPENGTYTVDLRSHFFDASLRLETEDGATIAAAEDGVMPGSPHARLTVELAAGRYQIAVAASDGRGGEYRLTAEPGVPPPPSAEEIATFAINDAREALAAVQSTFGPDHDSVRLALERLGYALWRQERYAEALDVMRRQLDLAKRLYGPDDERVAFALHELSAQLDGLGRSAEAIDAARECIMIYERVAGVEDDRTTAARSHLGGLLRDAGRASEAKIELERALEAQERTGHRDLARTINNLAAACGDLGESERAFELHRRALAVEEARLGRGHPDTALMVGNFASALYGAGRLDEALEHYERALELNRQRVGDVHSLTRLFEEDVADLRRELGRQE